MLAANSFSLMRAQDVVPKLRLARLLDPDQVCDLELGAMTVQLARAGYDRGMLTSMFAKRLQALVQSVRDGMLDGLDEAVATTNEAQAMRLLTAIKGVGPIVARNAWTLLLAMRDQR